MFVGGFQRGRYRGKERRPACSFTTRTKGKDVGRTSPTIFMSSAASEYRYLANRDRTLERI